MRDVSVNSAIQELAPGRALLSSLCAPGIFQVAISMLSAPTFSPGAVQCPLGFIAAKPLTFKTRGSLPHWLQELTKFHTSHFPNHWLCGGVPVRPPVCLALSLTLLSDHGFLPCPTVRIHFSPQPCLFTSCLLQWGFFSLCFCSLFCQSSGRFLGYLG